jgi:subtilisin family serine protease
MRVRGLLLPVCLAIGLACTDDGPAGLDGDGSDLPGGGAVPDQVLARLAPGVDVREINDRYGTRTLAAIESQRVYLLGVPAGTGTVDLLPSLRLDPGVSSASANAWITTPEAQGRSTMAFADPSLHAADREDQQALARIRAQEAWARSRGSGVVVAVLDTGVDVAHPQLVGHLAAGAADLLDGDADPSDQPDGADSDGDGLVDEAVGHGTFVAGLILSVAPDARILPVRILDSDGVGSAVDIARGVEIAVERGARVVNLSLGMEIESEVLEEVIEENAREKGIVFVSSGGNGNSDRPQYPAGQSEVMGVAATTPGDAKAPFSNWGSWLSVAAPGEGLVSLLPAGGMGRWSGTSFASALASGHAAVLVAFAGYARSDEVRRSMEESGVELGDPRLSGIERIDVAASLDLLEERLGIGREEIEFVGAVASIELVARIVRLSDGTTISVPHDGVIEDSGDFATLAAAAAGLGSGAVVRAEGRAVQEGASLRAIEIRFENEDGDEDDEDGEDGEDGEEDDDDESEEDDSGDDGDSDDGSGDESDDEGDGSDDDAPEDDSADG